MGGKLSKIFESCFGSFRQHPDFLEFLQHFIIGSPHISAPAQTPFLLPV
jgi:hypothetical protein